MRSISDNSEESVAKRVREIQSLENLSVVAADTEKAKDALKWCEVLALDDKTCVVEVKGTDNLSDGVSKKSCFSFSTEDSATPYCDDLQDADAVSSELKSAIVKACAGDVMDVFLPMEFAEVSWLWRIDNICSNMREVLADATVFFESDASKAICSNASKAFNVAQVNVAQIDDCWSSDEQEVAQWTRLELKALTKRNNVKTGEKYLPNYSATMDIKYAEISGDNKKRLSNADALVKIQSLDPLKLWFKQSDVGEFIFLKGSACMAFEVSAEILRSLRQLMGDIKKQQNLWQFNSVSEALSFGKVFVAVEVCTDSEADSDSFIRLLTSCKVVQCEDFMFEINTFGHEGSTMTVTYKDDSPTKEKLSVAIVLTELDFTLIERLFTSSSGARAMNVYIGHNAHVERLQTKRVVWQGSVLGNCVSVDEIHTSGSKVDVKTKQCSMFKVEVLRKSVESFSDLQKLTLNDSSCLELNTIELMGKDPTDDACDGLDAFSVMVGVIAVFSMQGAVVFLKSILSKARDMCGMRKSKKKCVAEKQPVEGSVSGEKVSIQKEEVVETTPNSNMCDMLVTLKRDELVSLCRSRKLKVTGTKAELVLRLEANVSVEKL